MRTLKGYFSRTLKLLNFANHLRWESNRRAHLLLAVSAGQLANFLGYFLFEIFGRANVIGNMKNITLVSLFHRVHGHQSEADLYSPPFFPILSVARNDIKF